MAPEKTKNKKSCLVSVTVVYTENPLSSKIVNANQ